VFLGGAFIVPRARADEWNQATKLRLSEPIEIPGRVLPAGTYWFMLLGSQSNRNVVQIFSADWSKLYATELTVPVLQRRPASRTEVSFAERRHDRPEALLTWFYPGMQTGHQFIYPAREQMRLDRDARQRVLAPPAGVTGGGNSARISGM
jgi:hypothetical protein